MEADDEYFVPLQDQRVFGAGIKRKRVNFVPAETSPPPKPAQNLSSSNKPWERYLSIVLPREELSLENPQSDDNSARVPQSGSSPPICEICNLPIDLSSDEGIASPRPHEASLAHQVCLSHSHPPSHLDRTRQGLKYLSSYGWDPDSRRGLGTTGAGIRAPIKTKAKRDTAGLGVKLESNDERGSEGAAKKLEKLDAKRVRKEEEKGKKKRERLQEMFYRNDDVERYLGHSA
ncbi:hypothetical protein MMC20_006500 [Loxospora ochrophaea]|nr:hypothetical protein [Loxospora ochrophaea]